MANVSAVRRTRLEPDARRAQIIEAARIAFADQPYADVSLSDVARVAGVSRSLLNHYFEGKVDLLVALIREQAAEAPAALRDDLGLPPGAMVAANTDAWLDYVEGNRISAITLLGGGPLAQPAPLQGVIDQLREAMVDRIAENHFGPGAITPGTRMALRAFTGLFSVACHEWLVAERMTREQVRTLVVTSLLAILRDVVPALDAQG